MDADADDECMMKEEIKFVSKPMKSKHKTEKERGEGGDLSYFHVVKRKNGAPYTHTHTHTVNSLIVTI